MLETAPRLLCNQKVSSIYSPISSLNGETQPLPVRLVSFKRQEQLNVVNHSLWKIHKGYIRTLTCDSQGDPVPIGFWTVGDIVGYSIAQTYPYIAQCVTAVEAEYLDVGYKLSRETLLLQVRQSHMLLRIAHCKHAEQRLLQLICWLAERFGHPVENGRRINLKLTHQEIAESIGITRVTVTRLLKTLERKGHIVWNSYERLVSQATFEQCYVALSSQPA